MATRQMSGDAEHAAVIRQHQAGLWRYLRFLGAPAELAEDLAQETLVAALGARIFDSREDPALAAWLRTTGHNLLRAHIRRVQRQGATVDFSVVESELAERAWQWCTERGKEGADDGASMLADLERCLQSVGKREHRALTMRYHDGSSREEIGTALDLSAAGVKGLLRRARHRLRVCIERRRQDRES